MKRFAGSLLWTLAGLGLGCQAHSPDASERGSAETFDAPLPASLKGYELYAWDEGGTVAFTLITGTNRQKTVAEITTDGKEASSGEWVLVRGQGQDDLKSLLARVPAESAVVLTELEGLAPLSAETRSQISQLIAEK
jgi:hypothetical protein